jgi:hypothetical protein
MTAMTCRRVDRRKRFQRPNDTQPLSELCAESPRISRVRCDHALHL